MEVPTEQIVNINENERIEKYQYLTKDLISSE